MSRVDKKNYKSNPYSNLPASRYWRTAVAERHIMDMDDLYSPRFTISPSDRVAVAGSCFAQHVGRHLIEQGFTVLNTEPTPDGLPLKVAHSYGYGIYSARYGNIYSVRQLLQLIRDCETGTIREEDFWARDGRIYDALRPNIEPDGFESLNEAILHRRHHLAKVRELFHSMEILVFTLGLTEAWESRTTGTVYPTAPGVIAGEFDDEKYNFINFDYGDVTADLVEVRSLLKAINPEMKFLLTVSPVPLTATASGKNVLVATTYSKSVLRACCGWMSDKFDDVDYFPSYELIASPPSRAFFFEANMRSVNSNGVAFVMSRFLKAHMPDNRRTGVKNPSASVDPGSDDTPQRIAKRRAATDAVCEDELLEAFAK